MGRSAALDRVNCTDIAFQEKNYTEDLSLEMGDFHYHSCYEIYYLFSGERRYLIDYDLFDISTGDIVLIKKNKLHMTKRIKNPYGDNMKIYIAEEAFDKLGKSSEMFKECFEHNHVVIPTAYKKKFFSLFSKIQDEYKKSTPFSEQITHNLLYELLANIHDLLFNDTQQISTAREESNDTITKAIKYIYNHYNQNINLSNIAKYVNTNPSYFSRTFKKTLGLSLTDYINHIRIKNAVSLIVNTDLPITEIAYNCGYTDQTYFCKIFKKINDCSPREFRKQNLRL